MCSSVVHDVAQRSPAWFALRAGRLTGTGAAAIVATVKKGEAAARRDQRVQLVVERLTGRALDEHGYRSPDMQWGIDHEADARRAYEARTGHVVEPVGFLAHPELLTGCSPDGVIGPPHVVDGIAYRWRGCVEIKCPKPATHLDAVRRRAVPAEYLPQVHHALWLSGAQWCDYVSFDPRFPRALQLVVARVRMSEHERAAWEITVRAFLTEVDQELRDVARLAA